MINFKYPGNETKTHFMLKEIAKYILFAWGYKIVATEVYGMWTGEYWGESEKNIIDTVGAKKITNFIPGKGYNPYWDIKGIEAKASYADFKNGFCQAPAYSYVIAPINTVPIDELPKHIGLIEVDLDKFKIKKYFKTLSDFQGVTLVKRAKKNIDKRFGDEATYRKWCEDTVERIAYRTSTELLFKRSIINFGG
jgi:hypothetical protein